MEITQVTSGPAQDKWPERFDRYGRLALLPMLAASTALAVIGTPADQRSSGRFAAGLGIVLVAAAWTAAVPSRRRSLGPRGGVAVFVVHLGIVATLVALSPWFGLFAWTGYVVADERLPRRRAGWGFAAVALVAATAQTGGPRAAAQDWPAFSVVAAVNLAIALLFVLTTERMFAHNQELMAANESLAVALAENAGLHAQLVVQAREAGVLDERQRLAGEIHDTLAQGLAGIVTQLEAAEVAHDHERSAHLGRARELARDSLREARRSVRALRPEQLEQDRLDDAIGALVRRWASTSGVTVTFEHVPGTRRLAPDVETTLFRVAQEALTNVAKHARADRVGVTLTELPDVVLLDVRDDGVGGCVTGTPGPAGGYGLPGMHDRLARIGGRLTLESAPGEGTALSAAIPLPSGRERDADRVRESARAGADDQEQR